MINIAVLTGRGGSSLVDKNIRLVAGKPVLSYPCIAANHSGIFENFFCSSDDSKILDKALDFGFQKIIRPDVLGKDDAKHVDVITHTLEYLESLSIKPDVITVLMANSATISSLQLSEAFNILEDNKTISSVTPVVENQDHHPFRARKIENGLIESYFDHNHSLSSNRQELPKNYFFTHSFWMIRLENGKLPYSDKATPWNFMGDNIAPLIVDYSIDIHDLEDIAMTEQWLLKNQK